MINKILNKYIDNEKFLNFTDYSPFNIERILELCGNPHNGFKSIHIAGTNGKGSIAFILNDILKRSGYKTGLYTSPHLLSINERIKINSGNICDSDLLDYVKFIDSLLSDNHQIHATYFDILTAIAFCYFRDKKIDIAVIETGLGGRLDSTNVIRPEITILTDISMDHMHILGNTLSDITHEKCGIIKRDIPIVTSNTDPSIINIITKVSEKNRSELSIYNTDYFAENIRHIDNGFIFDFRYGEHFLKDIELPLFPVHQVKNASTAITALMILKEKGMTGIIKTEILNGLREINVPGRFQFMLRSPLIIYDPAHNYNAIRNLIDGINEYYPEKEKVYVITLMKDKANNETLDLFKDVNKVYFLINDQREYKPDSKFFNVVLTDIQILIDLISQYNNDNLMIIFTGTFRLYLYADELVKKLKQAKK